MSTTTMQLRKQITAVKTGKDPSGMRRVVMSMASQAIAVLLEEDSEGVSGPVLMETVMGVLKEVDSTIDWEKERIGIQRVLVGFVAIVFDPDMAGIVADTHATILSAND